MRDAITTAHAFPISIRPYFGSTQIHRAYPVVQAGRLVGMADRRMLSAALDEGRATATVGELCASDANFPNERLDIALPEETCRHVAARLAARSLDRVPVVADTSSYRLIGIVSRHDLVKPSVSIFNEERERERFRRISLFQGRDSVATESRE
ncbi:CBS domain-containing protein [Paraburkholderia youngii]|uniref:CBS domain-containing protein n=1 Tax=Paraburkholderia youngii TaxID=2782701 RepID=UPI0034A546B0